MSENLLKTGFDVDHHIQQQSTIFTQSAVGNPTVKFRGRYIMNQSRSIAGIYSYYTGWAKLSDTTLHFFACKKLMHKRNFMIFGTYKLHKATNGMLPILC